VAISYLRGMNDFITGEKFIELADFVYAPRNAGKDCNPLVNTFHYDNLKEKNIVYTHTMYAKQLFDIIRKVGSKFIVITHNCDEIVDDTFDVPYNVLKWYAQNVNINDPKIESIPIGLENNKWFKPLDKKGRMAKKLTERKKFKNLVYLNVNINTNPRERVPVYQYLKDKYWVTVEKKVNGQDFESYIDNIYNHKFVACPQGNGIDTHRLWETLYMKSVPIVKKGINSWFYNDLPILYVNEWQDVNEELLNNMWPLYNGAGEKDYEKLKFSFWKEKISKEAV
jgi:hypothetical protein